MVCSNAAIVYTLSNYSNLDVNWFNRRDCDVNPEEHERIIERYKGKQEWKQ